MSDAERGMEALQAGRTEEAAGLLRVALTAEPDRVDLHHALGVALLASGEAGEALSVIERAETLARAGSAPMRALSQILLTRANAHDDLGLPHDAESAFRAVLKEDPRDPRATVGLGHLLLAWGRRDEGRSLIGSYLEARNDEPEFLEAEERFLGALDRFSAGEGDPWEFLDAHRGAYVEFFDETVARLEPDGWIAEAAQMRRDESGNVVPVVPPDRPYAAVRVDVVNPATSQPGQVGDVPMIVALAGYEGLAHAPVVYRVDGSLPLWLSSQVPWNQLPIRIQFGDGATMEAFHEALGPWFHAGWSGAFGTRDRGRFHFISEPTAPRNGLVAVEVDLGRAERRSIDDLVGRLGLLHERGVVRGVLIGRGHLPV